MKNRAPFCTLMLLSLTLCFTSGVYASPQGSTIFSLFAEPNFKGSNGRYFELASDDWTVRLEDKGFNDMASSINVPDGLVVIAYEHAAVGGGYGRWVDFLEPQPNLAKYDLDKKISYLHVFKRRKPDGSYWVRNNTINGQFVPGHWYKPSAGTAPPNSPIAVVAPPLPPPPPAFCSVTGQVKYYSPIYASVFTLILYRDDTKTELKTTVRGTRYTIPNVPEGTYEIRGAGFYKPNKHAIFPDGSQQVTCRNGSANRVNFRIDSGD